MILSAIAAAVVLGQQSERMFDSADNYGKTADQVVAMGYDRWYDFFVEKGGGETTLSMAGATYTYGCALHDVNDDRLKLVESERKKNILILRPNMLEFGNDSILIGMAVSGGGSMWRLFGANTLHAAEDVVADLISKPVKMQTCSQKEVWDKLSEVEVRISAAGEEINESTQISGMTMRDAQNAYKRLRFAWVEALPTIAKFKSVEDRGRIMKLYLNAAETARWAGE